MHAFFVEFKPSWAWFDRALQIALKDRLVDEDSPDKVAVVIGGSAALARSLGLHKTRLLILDYPEFTIENLALLADSYDFVIADRALHRCENLDNAVSETLRVLRPGGWYVCAINILDVALGVRWDMRRLTGRALNRLFRPGADRQSHGRTGIFLSWAIGRKSETYRPTLPAIDTIARERRRYPPVVAPQGVKRGIVAMARNEAPYLLEWIAYYRLLGFGHIVIYDNDSNDASKRILYRLAKAGVISAVYWHVRPGVHKQQSAYGHALAQLRGRVEWCLFVDLDEYLVVPDGQSLDDILPTDPEIGAVAFPWRVFGSAGFRYRDTDLTIERFTRSAATADGAIKCIVRPEAVRYMHTHWPTLQRGQIIDSMGNPIVAGEPVPPDTRSRAWIHHYCIRSWEEFQCKRARGRGAGPHGDKRDESLFFMMDKNEVTILDALRFVPAVQREVDRLRAIIRN